jgi:hypothetical protein
MFAISVDPLLYANPAKTPKLTLADSNFCLTDVRRQLLLDGALTRDFCYPGKAVAS